MEMILNIVGYMFLFVIILFILVIIFSVKLISSLKDYGKNELLESFQDSIFGHSDFPHNRGDRVIKYAFSKKDENILLIKRNKKFLRILLVLFAVWTIFTIIIILSLIVYDIVC